MKPTDKISLREAAAPVLPARVWPKTKIPTPRLRAWSVSVESSDYSADWLDHLLVLARSKSEAEELGIAHVMDSRVVSREEIKYAVVTEYVGAGTVVRLPSSR